MNRTDLGERTALNVGVTSRIITGTTMYNKDHTLLSAHCYRRSKDARNLAHDCDRLGELCGAEFVVARGRPSFNSLNAPVNARDVDGKVRGRDLPKITSERQG